MLEGGTSKRFFLKYSGFCRAWELHCFLEFVGGSLSMGFLLIRSLLQYVKHWPSGLFFASCRPFFYIRVGINMAVLHADLFVDLVGL